MMRDEAAAGDAYVLIDLMVSYGWAYTDRDGNEWTGKPQRVQALNDEE